jgi:hypothetical protein
MGKTITMVMVMLGIRITAAMEMAITITAAMEMVTAAMERAGRTITAAMATVEKAIKRFINFGRQLPVALRHARSNGQQGLGPA